MSPSDANPPICSVIIPVYNDAKDLVGCLDCLAAQTMPTDQFEVIVVDNGSKEPPEALVAKYPFAVYTTESKPGSYSARNKALKIARGQLLAFTDADCRPLPEWLENGTRALTGSDAVDVVAGRVDVEARDPKHPNIAELFDIARRFDQKSRVAQENGVVTANMLTRRDVMDGAGPFNDDILSGADALWSQSAAEQGYRVAYVDDAPVIHPARTTVASIRKQVLRMAHGRFDIVQSQKSEHRPSLLKIAARKILPRTEDNRWMRQRLKQRGYGFFAWLKVVLLLQVIHYSGTLAQFKRLLTGKSERG